ncbi:hypothetical protein FE772_05970 [Lysobacter enzymogenes]|nr:hypothetical protein FE772_05970 [Lysobacter enzymogenes]
MPAIAPPPRRRGRRRPRRPGDEPARARGRPRSAGPAARRRRSTHGATRCRQCKAPPCPADGSTPGNGARWPCRWPTSSAC